MNSCSVANLSATSLVAASVIVRSLLDGEDVGFDVRADDADGVAASDADDTSGSVYRLSPRLTYSCMKFLVSGLIERPLRTSALRLAFDMYSGASPIVFCASSI